ncbi:hypothetical protein O971_02675 [Mycobacterium avium subsp. hominissuis 10-4249]|nr:hypothetical protein O971_02675 [Mycobacterium avium subsp. hominissuis 10-4249]KDO94263.1 hypothetical protein MAVA5_18190 [Mycobacterium avium subsp. hominissuis A5]
MNTPILSYADTYFSTYVVIYQEEQRVLIREY